MPSPQKNQVFGEPQNNQSFGGPPNSPLETPLSGDKKLYGIEKPVGVEELKKAATIKTKDESTTQFGVPAQEKQNIPETQQNYAQEPSVSHEFIREVTNEVSAMAAERIVDQMQKVQLHLEKLINAHVFDILDSLDEVKKQPSYTTNNFTESDLVAFDDYAEISETPQEEAPTRDDREFTHSVLPDGDILVKITTRNRGFVEDRENYNLAKQYCNIKINTEKKINLVQEYQIGIANKDGDTVFSKEFKFREIPA